MSDKEKCEAFLAELRALCEKHGARFSVDGQSEWLYVVIGRSVHDVCDNEGRWDGDPEEAARAEARAAEAQKRAEAQRAATIVAMTGTHPAVGPVVETEVSVPAAFVVTTFAALDEAFRQFGEYPFFDKGPTEVMDVGALVHPLRAMSPDDASACLEALLAAADRYRIKRAVPSLLSALLGEVEAWDALWEALPENVTNHY